MRAEASERPPKIAVEMRINGRGYERYVEPRRLLCDFVRYDVGLTGTHIGCEHGACGACTVMVSSEPVKSCLMLAVQARGAEVLTVEGLERLEAGGLRPEAAEEQSDAPPAHASRLLARLHPIQTAFHEHHGLQCGFCTPGMLISALALLQEDPSPTEDEIKLGMEGNLCRCTGYYNIVESVLAAAVSLQQ